MKSIPPSQLLMSNLIKMSKGSIHVNSIKNRPLMASSGTKNFIKFLFICFIIVLSLSLFAFNNEKVFRFKLLSSVFSRLDIIKFFCSSTQDPDSCVNNISSYESAHNSLQELSPDEFFIPSNELAPNSFQEHIPVEFSIPSDELAPSPDEFLRISLKVAIQNLTRVISLAERLPLITSINGAESALSTCRDTFRDSITYLTRSLTTMGGEDDSLQPLTSKSKIDIMEWMLKSDSALLMCVDLLDYSGQAVSDLSLKVYRARTLVNNCYYFLLTNV